jgi:hypothetical protein
MFPLAWTYTAYLQRMTLSTISLGRPSICALVSDNLMSTLSHNQKHMRHTYPRHLIYSPNYTLYTENSPPGSHNRQECVYLRVHAPQLVHLEAYFNHWVRHFLNSKQHLECYTKSHVCCLIIKKMMRCLRDAWGTTAHDACNAGYAGNISAKTILSANRKLIKWYRILY